MGINYKVLNPVRLNAMTNTLLSGTEGIAEFDALISTACLLSFERLVLL
jgi:hypothetical protein